MTRTEWRKEKKTKRGAKHPENGKAPLGSKIRDIPAGMKLGLTGTPIENSLTDLKALLDLTIPGYLGSDDRFINRYVQPNQLDLDSAGRKELIRLVSPFTLRRLKKTVLSELPDKIEDVRACMLSEDQIKLYRDAISSRGGARPIYPYLRTSHPPEADLQSPLPYRGQGRRL